MNFGFPRRVGGEFRPVVAWSRIFSESEVLLAINIDRFNQTTAWVTIDNSLHVTRDKLKCMYSTQTSEIGQQIQIEARNGKAVELSVPQAGFVIYQ